MIQKLTLLTAILLLINACETTNNSPEIQADFKVLIENIAEEKAYQSSGVFNTPVDATEPAPIFPGESYEVSFNATAGSKLSFATMFVQSNDLFYAPDPAGINLFDSAGDQLVGNITDHVMLWDVGSELNQEPGLGMDQAPRQSGANTGATDTDNTVRMATDDFMNLPAVSDVIEVNLSSSGENSFTLRLTNVSSASTLSTSDGGSVAVPLAPGLFVVHTQSNVLFEAGMSDFGLGLVSIAEDGDPSTLITPISQETGVTQLYAPGIYVVHETINPLFTPDMADRGDGLEDLAEDGNPGVLSAALDLMDEYSGHGVFNTPLGAGMPGPLAPGASYEFSLSAMEGDKLSLALMLVQSNDLFIANDGNGISLFTNSSAVSGDITSEFSVWDAGTELNETPGFGSNQAPRQAGVNVGQVEMATVHEVSDMYMYPAVSDIIRITITEE